MPVVVVALVIGGGERVAVTIHIIEPAVFCGQEQLVGSVAGGCVVAGATFVTSNTYVVIRIPGRCFVGSAVQLLPRMSWVCAQ